MDSDIFFSEDYDFIFNYLEVNNIDSLYCFSIIIKKFFMINSIELINKGIEIKFFDIDVLLENYIELFTTKCLFNLIRYKKEYFHKIYKNTTLFLCSINSLKIFKYIYENSDIDIREYYKDNEQFLYCLEYEISHKYKNYVLWRAYCNEIYSKDYIEYLNKLYNISNYIFQNDFERVNESLEYININQRTIKNTPIIHFCNSEKMLELFINKRANLNKCIMFNINDSILKGDIAYSMFYVPKMYNILYNNGYQFDYIEKLLNKCIMFNTKDKEYFKEALKIIVILNNKHKTILKNSLPFYLFYDIQEYLFLK